MRCQLQPSCLGTCREHEELMLTPCCPLQLPYSPRSVRKGSVSTKVVVTGPGIGLSIGLSTVQVITCAVPICSAAFGSLSLLPIPHYPHSCPPSGLHCSLQDSPGQLRAGAPPVADKHISPVGRRLQRDGGVKGF